MNALLVVVLLLLLLLALQATNSYSQFPLPPSLCWLANEVDFTAERESWAEPYLAPSTFCLVGIFGHCIAQIPYLLSMLIAQNCTKVLTFVTHRKLAFHMPHSCFPTPPAACNFCSILRISQLQFAQLFNDKLPNVSDSTSNYAIVCPVQALPLPPFALPLLHPVLSTVHLEWPSKNVFTIHCSTCLLWLTCRYSLRQRAVEEGGRKWKHIRGTMWIWN